MPKKNDNTHEVLEQVCSPIGKASWPSLVEPDTNFDKDGVFKVDLVLDPGDAESKAFIDNIQKLYDEFRADHPSVKDKDWNEPPVIHEEDDEGNPTGHIMVRFKRKASGTTRKGKEWKFKVPLYDAAAEDIDTEDGSYNPGGGSLMSVSADVIGYVTPLGAGIRLSIKGVQVIKYVPQSGHATAKDLGFKPQGAPVSAGSAAAPDKDEPEGGDF